MRQRDRLLVVLIPVVIIGVVVARILLTEETTKARRPTATLVRVDSPRVDTVFQTLTLTGDVLPIQQAQIFSKIYATLERVYVNIGDRVSAGQTLALVDTTELAQQFQQVAATYQNTQRKYQRARELAEQNLSAKQDLDNIEAELKVDEAEFANAQTRLGFATITAPFDGYITRRYLDPGAVLTSNNATLLTLMDLESVKIIVHVLERDVPLVTEGMKAVVTVDALPAGRFSGTITRLSQALDLDTRTMAVEIDIPNPDHVLKPGMFATVSLLAGMHPHALTVPSQVLFKDDTGYFLFIADSSTAHRRAVTIGGEQQSRTEILTGLDDAESIIVSGQQLVKDGGAITIQR